MLQLTTLIPNQREGQVTPNTQGDKHVTGNSLVPHLFLYCVMINEVHPDTYPACFHGSVWFHSEFMTLEV